MKMKIFQTINRDFSGMRLVLNHASHKPKAQRKMCSAPKWRAEVPKSASKVIIMQVVKIRFQMRKQILRECALNHRIISAIYFYCSE